MDKVVQPNTWRDAMDDELICTHLGTADSFPSAQAALAALIDWRVSVALDPEVSSDAQALIDRGAAQPQAEPVTCSDGTPCVHGNWCTEVYCQKHCEFLVRPAAPAVAEPLTPLPEPKKYFGIDAEPDFLYFTAGQMHEYAAAVSAVEIDKLRYERDLLRIVVEGTAAADELLETPEAIYRLARIAREALGETK